MDHESPRRGSPQLAMVSEPHHPDYSVSSDTPLPAETPRPAAAASAAPRGAEATAATRSASAPLKVCVVEDSYSTLRTIFKVLKERNADIDHFSQVEDASVALGDGSYDFLVVSDSISGGARACDALITWVRQSSDPAVANLPVLALTALDGAARRRALRAVGASAVLAGFSESRFQSAFLNLTGQPPAPPETAEPRRICLLEDSYSLSLVLSGALAQAGHEVDHFAQASEALSAMRGRRYDVLVAGQNDMRADLPCGQFIEHARTLMEAAGTALPVIVLTNDASPANVQALRRAGADRILTRNAVNLEQHVLAFAARVGRAEHDTPPRSRASAAAMSELPSDDAEASSHAPPATPAQPVAESIAPAAPQPQRGATAANAHSVAPTSFPPPANAPAPQPVSRSAASRKRTGPLWWGVTALLVLGGVLLWYLFLERTPVELVSAKLGPVARSIEGAGHVVSKQQVDLPPPQAGQLFRVFVDEGNLVRKGEPLATLDNREAVINVRRAEAQVYRYRTEVELADKTLKEWGAEKNLEVSKLMVRDLQQSRSLAAAKLRVAEQELKAAQLAHDRLAIEAPFAGMVTQSFAVEGKWVEPRMPLFTLADLETWEVAVRIKSAEAAEIAPGRTVRLSTEGAASEEWTEKVLRIAPSAAVSSGEGTLARGDAIVYVSLGDEAPALEFGERVLAEIITESVDNTVKVPYEAILEREGKTYVAIVEDQRVKYRPVETGVRSLAHVEIVKGLGAGDQVILPRVPLEEGERVVVTAIAEGVGLDVEDYPFREAYPDVKVLSTAELREQYDQVLIVDVRSKFEYDVVHIASAVNVPLSDMSFVTDLEPVRAKDDPRPLVFYCNGITCSKSYEAARKAASGGYQNVLAYDAGIFRWMAEQRERTTLLGETPVPLRRIISEDYFQGRLLSFDAFQRKAEANESLVIDVRDAMQQASTMPLPATHVPLDEFVARLDAGEYRGKQLLIFDAVGKQVRWLQYILEHRGHKEYFFLRDGIAALDA